MTSTFHSDAGAFGRRRSRFVSQFIAVNVSDLVKLRVFCNSLHSIPGLRVINRWSGQIHFRKDGSNA